MFVVDTKRFLSLAELAPPVITLVFVVSNWIALQTPSLGEAVALFLCGFQGAWALDLYLLSESRAGRSARGSVFAVFVMPSACMLTMIAILHGFAPALRPSAALPSDITSFADGVWALLIIAAAIAFFSSMWMSAQAFVRAEAIAGAATRGVVGTFLAVVYLFVGVWWVSPRVRRLLAPLQA